MQLRLDDFTQWNDEDKWQNSIAESEELAYLVRASQRIARGNEGGAVYTSALAKGRGVH